MTRKSNLTSTEENKSRVINLALEKKITNGVAAKQLGLTVRQVQRLKQKMIVEGESVLIHGLKGKISNHKIDEVIKEKTLSIIKEKYYDFKPGFTAEKLHENHQITISPDTALRWMTEEKLWKPRKQRKRGTYRSWRPRKEYYGEMEQFDGCYHLWLEDRYKDSEENPIELCLLLSVDDATGKITNGYFDTNEGIIPVYRFWKTYVLINGKPVTIYLSLYFRPHPKVIFGYGKYTKNAYTSVQKTSSVGAVKGRKDSWGDCFPVWHSSGTCGQVENDSYEWTGASIHGEI